MMDKKKYTVGVIRQKLEAVLSGAELLMSITLDWQIIRQYLCNRLNKMELSKTQQGKLERYQFIYNQLASRKSSKSDVINNSIKKFHVSRAQAYEDVSCTQEIFMSILNISKLSELQMELESAKSMQRKCLETHDIATAAILQKNIITLLAMLPNQHTDIAIEDFESHTFIAVFDPKLLGAPEIDMTALIQMIEDKRKEKRKIEAFSTTLFNKSN